MPPAAKSAVDDERGNEVLDPFLRDPIGVLVRRWRPMLIGSLIVLAATAFTAIRMQPLFQAQATISVLGSRISENLIAPTVEIGTLDQINAIVSEVLSRKNLADIVVAQRMLDDEKDDLRMEAVVQAMRERVEVSSESELGRQRRTNMEASRVYALAYRDADPDRAAAIANALASSFIDVHLRLRSGEARVTTEFLRRELDEVAAELNAQERLATEFKQEFRGELPGELSSNMARLARLQEDRRVLVDQLRSLQAAPAAEVEVAAADGSPEARLLVLRRRLNDTLSLYTPDHPNVVALRRQVEAFERQLGIEGTTSVSSLGVLSSDTRLVQRRLAEIDAELAELDTRVARTPKRQEEQEALDRKLTVLRENYTELLRKVDQAELSESVESAQHGVRVSILDRAVPPTMRESSRAKVILIGLLAAFGLAGLMALLLEHFDAVVINGDQLESAYSLPVLGNVPHIS